MKFRWLSLALSSTLSLTPALTLLAAVSAAGQTVTDFDGQTWWDHIKFLADDKLEGRDTGSRGERKAQKYAVEQLKKAGAEIFPRWQSDCRLSTVTQFN
jgi:hypothetical protein